MVEGDVRVFTAPTRDVPGGFVLVPTAVASEQVHTLAPGDVLVPSSLPGCRQEHQPAWRTASAAETARAGQVDPDRWRVQWVPAVPDPVRGHLLLDVEAWCGIGGPIVVARDHFVAHPWEPGESRLHVLATPPEDVRRGIHRAYQPLLADQPGLAQLPPQWLHLTLCALPASGSATQQADAAWRLAEKLRADVRHKEMSAPRVVVGPATLNAHGIQLDVASPFPDAAVDLSRDEYLGHLEFSAREAAGVAEPRFWRGTLNTELLPELPGHLVRGKPGPRQDSDAKVYAALAGSRTVFYTPTVAGTLRELRDEIKLLTGRAEACIDQHLHTGGIHVGRTQKYVELLVIDEAERLAATALEHLRDTFDRTGIGVLLIGMPGIEKRLARYPAQLYSRVGFAHHYRPLRGDELSFVLTRHWRKLGLTLDDADFTDHQAITAIARITDGNFRLLHRLFVQIERILRINDLTVITIDVVEAARSTLVIGAT